MNVYVRIHKPKPFCINLLKTILDQPVNLNLEFSDYPKRKKKRNFKYIEQNCFGDSREVIKVLL